MLANGDARDARRIRVFVEEHSAVSETVLSLSTKLRVNRRTCRGVLERLVEEGLVHRRDFGDIEPVYYRVARH